MHLRNLSLRHLVIVMGLWVCWPVFAQTSDTDNEETFDQSLRTFGYLAGNAWQCSAEEAKPAIVDDVHYAYNGLVRLFGSERAFFFAAAFGAGTVDDINTEQCDQFIADFKQDMKTGAEAAREAQ